MWKAFYHSKYYKYIRYIIDACLSPFFLLLAFIIPKEKNLIVLAGRKESGFIDNIKYLYLYLVEHGYDKKYRIVYVGYREKAYSVLKKNGVEIVDSRFELIKSYWVLLRTPIVITDNAHWTTSNKYNAAYKAKKIQLWHGIGFKNIRLTDPKFVKRSQGIKGFITYILQGQLAKYDDLLCTSDYYANEVFIPAFLPKHSFIAGYPRNDVLLGECHFEEQHLMINADNDAYQAIKKAKAKGKKVVIYAPTFRNSKKYKLAKKDLDLARLSKFGKKNNILFVFKLHPLPKHKINFKQYSNVIEYNSKKDVYPIFQFADALITDYSSIYMDYLLTDKPCIFFWYDIESYVGKCRGIDDGFESLSPGAKCYTQDELFSQITEIVLHNQDDWKAQREAVRNTAWSYQGGQSCQNVWNYIETNYLTK